MNFLTQVWSSLHCANVLSRNAQIFPVACASLFPQSCIYRQMILRKSHVQSCNTCNATHKRKIVLWVPFNMSSVMIDSYRRVTKKSYSTHASSSITYSRIHHSRVQNKLCPNRIPKINCVKAIFHRTCYNGSFFKFSVENPVYANYLNSLVEEFQAAQSGQSLSIDDNSKSLDGQFEHQLSRFNFLREAVSAIDRLKIKHQEVVELTSLMQDEKDPEMIKMMETEVKMCKDELRGMEEELVDVLIGTDPADDSDIKLEVSAGVGGQEAMLFCQEIFHMYCNYALRQNWRLAEPISEDSEMGGARRASVEISGDGVHRQLKHEGGVHRVQRVPRTEKAGRIHTSTITVSITPLPKEIDINIEQKDLKVETFRNSGPGGQSVNTTDSAVRITHRPTGTVVEAKEERSQIKNRNTAMKKLKQRMYEAMLEAQLAQLRASRKQQQGTRARSEKIRTYNFQQDRVTDHRTRESMSNLSQLMAVGGEGLDDLIEGLLQQERYQILEMMLDSWEKGQGKS